jgi:head-tail adaptor
MKAGELRERFEFQEREKLPIPGDDHGVTEGGWVHRFECRAKIMPLRRGETVTASRIAGVQPYILTIRMQNAAKAVKTDWHCINKRTGEAFNIRTVEHDPKNASIDMLIEGGVVSG